MSWGFVVTSAHAAEFEAVNRIDYDPLVESVGNTQNLFAGTFGYRASNWQQVATLVRNLPIGGTLKEARFLVAGTGGSETPDPNMPFLQVSDFERFDFSFQLWTDGDESPGDESPGSALSSFFANPVFGDVVLELPAPGAPGFTFVKLPDTIPGFPLWEVTIDLAPFNIDVYQGQEFAFSLYGQRIDKAEEGDGFFAVRGLSHKGSHDLLANGINIGEAIFADHLLYVENNNNPEPYNQIATALTLEVDGPDVLSTGTTRATYIGASGGQFGQAENWDTGIAPLNNGTKYNAVIPDFTGVVEFAMSADAEATHLSLGSGNTLNVSGGQILTISEEAVIPGKLHAEGSGTSVHLSERTSVEQLGQLFVTGGAQIIAPIANYRFPRQATTTALGGPGITNTITPFRAEGSESVLDLSELKEIRGVLGTRGLTGKASLHRIEAINGGTIDLRNLETIDIRNASVDESTLTIDATSGAISLDSLRTLQMSTSWPQGIHVKFGTGDASLPSLISAPKVTFEKNGIGTLTLGSPTIGDLSMVGSRISASAGAIVDASGLTDFTFGAVELTGNGSTFLAPNIKVIDGSRLVLREGAVFELAANPTTPNGDFTYTAFFPAVHNQFHPSRTPTIISSGADTLVDLHRLVGVSVELGSPGLLGTGLFGEISALDGGVIDLSGLEYLEASPTGGVPGMDASAMFINVDSGGKMLFESPIFLQAVKIFVADAGSRLSADSFVLQGGSFPIGPAASDGNSLFMNDGGTIEVRERFSFHHSDIRGISSETISRLRDDVNTAISGLSFVEGGVDMNRGVIHFVGSGLGKMEVAGGEFLGFDVDGRPLVPEGRADFGIAQLVIGTEEEAKVVELENLVLNSGLGTHREALYLWGFGDGLPDFGGGPIGDGLGSSLVIHDGSTLLIPEWIDVVYFDAALEQFVHINSLFSPGIEQIPFDGGTIGLIPAPPGDNNGDGIVGPEDFEVWRSEFGATVVPPGSGADANEDGKVNLADFVLWRDHVAQPAEGSFETSSPIPEPSGVCMVLASLMVFAVRPVKARCSQAHL